MKGKVYTLKTADGRTVNREKDPECGRPTLEPGPVYKFVLGCHFTSTERACKVIGQRVGQELTAHETGETAQYFYA